MAYSGWVDKPVSQRKKLKRPMASGRAWLSHLAQKLSLSQWGCQTVQRMKLGQWSVLVIAQCCGAQTAAISRQRSDQGKSRDTTSGVADQQLASFMTAIFWPDPDAQSDLA